MKLAANNTPPSEEALQEVLDTHFSTNKELEERIEKVMDLLDTRVYGIVMDWQWRGESSNGMLHEYLNRLTRALFELETLTDRAKAAV